MNSTNIHSTNRNNVCNNCGKPGHQFHQCKLPITSYGIVLFRSSTKGIQYLMIRRKDSFGYIDFLRGKYIQNNAEHLQMLFNEMSVMEKNNIKNNKFETLWQNMWGTQASQHSHKYKSEELISQKKFENLKNCLNNEQTQTQTMLDSLIENSTTKWKETEWEFPKGRRNYQERDLECALREFEEETGLSSKDIKIIENVLPFEEIFIGSNHKSYKHKYFLAYADNMDDNLNNLDNYQRAELSKLDWKTLDECLETIRPYNLEKKLLIININTLLQEYRLYS